MSRSNEPQEYNNKEFSDGKYDDFAPKFDDETKVCVDCSQSFLFRQKDREFCEKNGWTPFKRCKPCRDRKKAQRDSSPQREGSGQV